jgi:hypothetical protein
MAETWLLARTPDGQAGRLDGPRPGLNKVIVGRQQVGPGPLTGRFPSVVVRYVAKHFLRRFLASNSLTIEKDLAEAFNLMTDALQAEERERLVRYEREHGDEFVSVVKRQWMKTVLEFDPKDAEVTETNGQYTVLLRGVAKSWPLNRRDEDEAIIEREFESFVTLVAGTHAMGTTPEGLLVAKVSRRFYGEGNHERTAADPDWPGIGP